jgi:MFS family permease
MNAGVRWRLAVMMVLLYAVQGAWWPLLAVHLQDLGISGRYRGWIFATFALASFLTPLGAGRLADHRMAAQRLLALIYAIGTGILAVLALGVFTHAGPLLLVFLVYWLLTAPAPGLSSALAFRNLARPNEQFGGVRLWGTAGWMGVGWLVSLVMLSLGSTRIGQGAYEAFGVAAVLSAVMAVYCLTLPHTPPLAGPSKGSHPLEALALVREPSVAAYLFVAFGVSLTTPFVYQVIPSYLESRGLPRPWTATAMTLGQVPEVGFLALMPWLLRRFGYRGTLGLGIAAWVLRYGSLALDPPLWVSLAGIPLHGVGIACFAVGGQVFLDSQAPADRRASAQALNVVITSGIGCLLGSLLAGEVAAGAQGSAAGAFLVPCLINLGLLLYFVQGFRPSTTTTERGLVPTSVCTRVREAARTAVVHVGHFGAESSDG